MKQTPKDCSDLDRRPGKEHIRRRDANIHSSTKVCRSFLVAMGSHRPFVSGEMRQSGTRLEKTRLQEVCPLKDGWKGCGGGNGFPAGPQRCGAGAWEQARVGDESLETRPSPC